MNPLTNTKVILLGTGNPNPDPQHSGNAVLILVGEYPYLIDFGPGLVRQASKLTPRYGGKLTTLKIEKLNRAFLTHLHSDHTVGYPDLILTPWVMGRDQPLEVYGPEGTQTMTKHILKAYQEDIRNRIYGLEPANNQGWRVNVQEITDGLIYQDKNVQVEAFTVKHGTWPNAFGFRFTTPDKTIVISGDTAPCENILNFGRGVDILLHEVYSEQALRQNSETWQKYHSLNHTSTLELAQIAQQTQPNLLVLYHTLFWGASEQAILSEISQSYQGKVVVGTDLQIIE